MATATEKYILNRSIHMGLIKQSYGAGTVIEKTADNAGVDHLVIDGKKYDETKDLIALKKLNAVVPYSKETLEQIKADAEKNSKKPLPKIKQEEDERNKQRHMNIVKSDEDEMNENIDISHTKTKPKEKVDKNAPMEVIKGDETAEERINRLSSSIPKLPVVEADEQGIDDGKPSLNAGKVKFMPPEKHEALRQEGIKKAKAGIQTVTPNTLNAQTPQEAATEVTSVIKKGRGRPKGALNKPKTAPQAPKTAPKVVHDDSLGIPENNLNIQEIG